MFFGTEKAAILEFEKMVESKQYYDIVLIYSTHPYSEGWWIETEKTKNRTILKGYDTIIKEYDGRAIKRDEKIKKILNS